MNLPFFIAKRYLVSKKKQNIINIISGISVAGIIVGTMALVIVMSVVNGFSVLMDSLFSSFDSDIKITSVEGKLFNPDSLDIEAIKNIEGVANFAKVIEEIAMLKYGSQQYFGTIKGVPDNYAQYTNIDSLIVDGEFLLEKDGINYAVVGAGVQYKLSIGLSFIDPIRIYVPKKGNQNFVNPARSINHNYIYPSGVFSVLEEIDSRYILVSFDYAADLFECENEISAIELGLIQDANIKKIQKEIKEIAGEKFHVKNKYQQHDLVYKTIKSEKWAAYLILIFILIVASFNILGSLSMLIIDKKDDILILGSMGASSKQVRRIFLFQGWLISLIGAFLGTLLGIFICWLQIRFGFVTLPGNGSFVISAYPVQIIFSDILMIFFAVLIIGFFAAWYPIKYISKKYLLNNNI